MKRCLQLAQMGRGNVAPNPLVGAVLVASGQIIGEGYHQEFGKAHAEVNCLRSVPDHQRHLIPGSTMYVSLEPCSHFGKTPPCADLLISEKIGKAVVGVRDPFHQVDGKGIEKLKQAGIEVVCDVLEKECRDVNRAFFHFHEERRCYVILKWAQSADGRIAGTGPGRTYISNIYTNRLVHQWRSDVTAIMVGSNTVVIDDPALTTRHWPGKDPVRIVLDPNLEVDEKKRVLDGNSPTIVFNAIKEEEKKNLRYIRIGEGSDSIPQMMEKFYELNVQSVIVEGGARLLQSFIDLDAWDEARVITNESLHIGNGLSAPQLQNAEETTKEKIETDIITTYFRKK